MKNKYLCHVYYKKSLTIIDLFETSQMIVRKHFQ